MAGRRVGLLHTPIVEPARVDEAVGRPAHSTVETAATRPAAHRHDPAAHREVVPGFGPLLGTGRPSRQERQMSGHAILIAGGYGVVGGRIAADLAPSSQTGSSSPAGTSSRPTPRPRRSGTAFAAAPWT